jgi:hypothetical protein
MSWVQSCSACATIHAVLSEIRRTEMRSTMTKIRLGLAVAAAAVIATVQAWGWSDAALTLAAGASWLWRRAGWPIVRVVALPLTAA